MAAYLESILPRSLSSETTCYVRATMGAMAACTFSINPVVGVMVLLGHGVWEYANLFMAVPKPEMSEQRRRVQAYNEAFKELYSQAQNKGSTCTVEEFQNARNIFFVHNLIEEVCYNALANIVSELGIKGDAITVEQSGVILAYVKKMAHVELRKEGGYTKKGKQMITPEQFGGVLRNIATIIHDRDGRLTDARYTSLTDLCTALDDHNNYVKNVLFKSWFKCEGMHSDSHLPLIKEMVDFNSRMSAQVGFNFEEALAKKKEFYDIVHKGIRNVQENTALPYVNLCEVKSKFTEDVLEHIKQAENYELLYECLDRYFDDKNKLNALFQPRCVKCAPRFHRSINQPALLSRSITVKAFLIKYFPQDTEQQQSHHAASSLSAGSCHK